MKRLVRWEFLTGVLAVGLTGSAVYAADPATQPSQQDLMERINSLQTEVAQLKSQQQQLQLQANTETAATNQRVLSDADAHSKLLDVGDSPNAGWNPDKGLFFIQSDDGNFLFHPGIIFQTRYVVNYRTGPTSYTNGFEIRRAKFYFDGNIYGKDLTYKFQWQDSNPGGAPTLEYGWGQYVFMHGVGSGDLAVRAGQFKNPIFKEEAGTGDTNQMMVERSMANSLVGGNSEGGPLIEGVDFMYIGGKNPIHADLTFDNGDNSGLTNFTITPPTNNFGAGLRVDYKIFGEWAPGSDLTGKTDQKDDFLDIAAGVHYSQGVPMTIAGTTQVVAGGVGSDTIRWDVDSEYQMAKRFVVYGVFYGDAVQSNSVVVGLHNRTDLGGMVEGAYLLSPSWELAARYSISRLDHRFKSVATGNNAVFNEIGAGVTYFMGDNGVAGNHAKATLDVNYLPNGSPALTGLDYLASPNGHQEIVLRLQFQLWI